MNMTISLKFKISLVITSLLLVAGSVFFAVSYVNAVSLSERVSNHVLTMKLRGDANAARRYLQEFYGDLSMVQGQLVGSRGRAVAGAFDMVDTLSAELGVVATIFAAEGDDFTRVTTNIMKADGDRAVGTKLGKASAAYGSMMRGEQYIGHAQILGLPYLASYEPIVDARGKSIELPIV